MNGRLPLTAESWANFIDAWAQYHKVSMPETARAALCNAFGNIKPEELSLIQQATVRERYLTPDDIIVHAKETSMGNPRRVVPTHPVTDVMRGVPTSSEPIQEVPSAPTRIVRRPPPATTVPLTSERTGRILRTPRKE